jgi:hypothetical protein
MDPHPASFVIDLQDANIKLFFKEVFLLITVLFKVHLHHFLKIKTQKEDTEQ